MTPSFLKALHTPGKSEEVNECSKGVSRARSPDSFDIESPSLVNSTALKFYESCSNTSSEGLAGEYQYPERVPPAPVPPSDSSSFFDQGSQYYYQPAGSRYWPPRPIHTMSQGDSMDTFSNVPPYQPSRSNTALEQGFYGQPTVNDARARNLPGYPSPSSGPVGLRDERLPQRDGLYSPRSYAQYVSSIRPPQPSIDRTNVNEDHFIDRETDNPTHTEMVSFLSRLNNTELAAAAAASGSYTHEQLNDLVLRGKNFPFFPMSLQQLKFLCDNHQSLREQLERIYASYREHEQIRSELEDAQKQLLDCQRQLVNLVSVNTREKQMSLDQIDMLRAKIVDLERRRKEMTTKDEVEFPGGIDEWRTSTLEELKKIADDTVTKAQERHRQELDALEKERSSLEEEFQKKLCETERKHRENIEKLEFDFREKESKWKALEEKFSRDMHELKEQFEEMKVSLEEKHVKEKEDIAAEHTVKLKSLEEMHAKAEKEKDEMAKKFETEKKSLLSEFDKEKELMRSEFSTGKLVQSKESESLQARFDTEKAALETKFAAEKEALKAQLLAEKDALKAEMERANNEAKEALRAELKKAHDSEKAQLQETHKKMETFLKDWQEKEKKGTDERHAAEKLSLQSTFELKMMQLQETFNAEKETLRKEHAAEKHQLAENFAKEKLQLEKELQEKKDGMHAEFEEEKKNLRESYQKRIDVLEQELALAIEKSANDIEAVSMEMQAVYDTAKASWDTKMEHLTKEYSNEKGRLEGKISGLENELLSTINKKRELEEQHMVLEEDKSRLEKEKEAAREELEKQIAVLDGRIQDLNIDMDHLRNLNKGYQDENTRLKKVVRRFGEAEEGNDVKTRGDGYYIQAFELLHSSIISLSKTITDVSSDPLTADSVVAIPQGLTRDLIRTHTGAGRLLRQALIQHVVSSKLMQRIFTPFLFTLDKNNSRIDDYLQSISIDLRRKSIRREAMWRIYTLSTNFTSSSAKKMAGQVASAVQEEIYEGLRAFVEPGKAEAIRAKIAMIVKLAVETWRYARLEKEYIKARMQYEKGDNELAWTGHNYREKKPYNDPSFVDIVRMNSLRGRAVVLACLPLIEREGTVPSAAYPDRVLDEGFRFVRGVALFEDCLPLLLRRLELSGKSNLPYAPHVPDPISDADREYEYELALSRKREEKRLAAEKAEKERIEKEFSIIDAANSDHSTIGPSNQESPTNTDLWAVDSEDEESTVALRIAREAEEAENLEVSENGLADPESKAKVEKPILQEGSSSGTIRAASPDCVSAGSQETMQTAQSRADYASANTRSGQYQAFAEDLAEEDELEAVLTASISVKDTFISTSTQDADGFFEANTDTEANDALTIATAAITAGDENASPVKDQDRFLLDEEDVLEIEIDDEIGGILVEEALGYGIAGNTMKNPIQYEESLIEVATLEAEVVDRRIPIVEQSQIVEVGQANTDDGFINDDGVIEEDFRASANQMGTDAGRTAGGRRTGKKKKGGKRR